MLPDFDGNDRLLRDLTSLVCHDILNDLNGIILQAAVMQQSAPQESRAEMANVQKLARSAANLANKLQEHNRDNIERQAVDINDLARSARDTLQERYPEARITLELMDERCSALGDASTLNRILWLLGWHSVSIASASKPQITITTRVHGNRCILTWHDNGPTVRDADLEKIFELLKARREGADEISLPIVSLLARRMRASIKAARAPAGGMDIILELPVA